MATARAEAFAGAKATVQGAVARAGGLLWDAMPSHDDADVPGFLDRLLPILEGGQRQTVALTEAFLALELDRPALGLDPDLIVAGIRGDVPPAEVYRRPFVTLWWGLKEGRRWEEANRAARARLEAALKADVALAMTHAMRAAAEADPAIAGFRRVVRGTCDLCLDAAGDATGKGVTMPIHPGCECVAEPTRSVSRMTYEGPRNGPVAQEVAALGERFPKIEGSVRQLAEAAEFGQLGGVSHRGIHLAPSFFDDAFMTKWAKEFRGIQVGDLSTVEGARQSVIVHEMGHFLEKQLALADKAAWRRLHEIIEADVSYTVDGRVVTAPRWQAGNVAGGELAPPSAYAAESPYEFIAESFADYIHNGPGAKLASRQIGEIVERAFGR